MDYSFLEQAAADFEHGLDYILTGSIRTPELDASFDESTAETFSVPSGFICLLSTISDH